jgi:glycosyltransferase involved in cell wall biosynthesis
MNYSTPKVLFISHDARRTGAPIVLKHHLAVLKNTDTRFKFDILLKEGGVLEKEFEKIAPTYSISPLKLADRIKRRILGAEIPQYLKRIIAEDYKIVFGNTVVCNNILVAVKKAKPSTITICYAHELEIAIKQFFGHDNFIESIPYIDYFLAASVAVKNNLTENYNIPEDKITVHYEHIPIIEDYSTTDTSISKQKGLKICSSGTMDWRKGIDVFIQTAYKLNKKNPDADFHFYWIGGERGSVPFEMTLSEIDKLSLGNCVTLIENCPDPLMYMQQCDLFLLTSREDPFPLVCLEAASLGKPIICFKKAGGMPEFVDDSSGWLIDYIDVDQLTDQLSELLGNDEIIIQKGKISKSKSKKYDIQHGAKFINDYINNLLQ